MASLTLRLFGSFDLQVEEIPIHGCSRAVQALLTLLALRPDRSVDRTWLAETLWPEASTERARFYLRRSLTELRTALGAERHRLLSPTSTTVRLDLSNTECDLLTFDSLLLGRDRSALEQALHLYRGPLLESWDEPWLLLERETRAAGVLRTVETLAEQAQQRGDSGEAARLLYRVITMEPLHEAGYCRLMEALAHAGDFAGVERQYRQLRLVLRDEMNTEPAAATTALYEGLCARSRAPQAALPATPSDAPTRRLPCPLTPLIGRSVERQEILQAKDRTRLLTLTGIGGVGKTRLAIAVAAESEPAYPDGVWFVDLSSVQESPLLPQAVARALSVGAAGGVSLEEALLQYLHAKRLLLVMDNCEHLIEGCAQWMKEILQECPEVHALCTSRQPLQLAGEMLWPVGPLAVPPEDSLDFGKDGTAGELRYYDSVALLLDRAATVASRFRLTPRNADAIVRICRRLDGIPLAIELAAARLRSLSIQEIADRLDDRFHLLTTGDRTLPRHQTLQAAMDWSYDLLNAPERLCLQQISVFAGGCTLAAAEAIVEDALDPLTSLVDKSLVVYQESENGAGRYRLLETVREYAQEKLRAGGERDAVHLRHRDYFLALAEEAETQTQGADQAAWFQRLEEEHDNLRAVLDRSLREPEGPTTGLRICRTLWRFWSVQGHYSEGRLWFARFLGLAGNQERGLERARVLQGAGALAEHQSDYAFARACHEESLSIRKELGDRRGIAGLLNSLGIVAHAQGDDTSARAYYEESMAISREIGDRQLLYNAMGNLGNVVWRLGDLTSARLCFEECLTVYRERGNHIAIGASLHSLGNVASSQEDYAAARTYYEESLTVFREIGHRQFLSNALGSLGSLAFLQEDDDAARTYFDESLTVASEIGDRSNVATSLESLASLAAVQEQVERACRLWGAAERLRENIGAPKPSDERPAYDYTVGEVRGLMNAETFAAAWATGRGMSMERAIAFAQGKPV